MGRDSHTIGNVKLMFCMGARPMIADHTLRPANEESLRALEFILKAWEGGTDEDIPPELIAYAAMFTALIELIVAFGEENVARLAEGLVKRIRNGEFTVPAQVH
jgi:hypothetical protein